MKQNEAFIKTFPFTLLVSAVLTVVLILIFDKYIGLSYLLGAMVSLMTMSMLYKSNKRLLELSKGDAEKKAVMNYFMRYMFYIVILVVAGISDTLNVLVVAIGLFTFKVVLMILLFIESRGVDNG